MKKHLLKLSTFASLPLVSLAAVSCSNNQNIPPRDYQLIDEEHGFAFNSLGEITKYIFYEGNNYTNITIPNDLTNNTNNTLDEYRGYTQRITSIGNGVFSTDTYSSGIPINPYAQYLTSITLSDYIESIGADAFKGTPITEIILPDSVVDIGDGAFKYCKNLTNVKLSKNTKYIGASSFSGTAITSIEIPDSVVTIDFLAFDGTQLKEVSIPKTCSYVPSAFPSDCVVTRRS